MANLPRGGWCTYPATGQVRLLRHFIFNYELLKEIYERSKNNYCLFIAKIQSYDTDALGSDLLL